MVTVSFLGDKTLLTGFQISGHSGYAEAGSDIICASVSSCAYMVANTVTDVLGLPARAEASDGAMLLKISKADALPAQAILKGFLLHVQALAEQYPAYLQCNTQNI